MTVDVLGTEYTVTRNTSAIEGIGADGICQPYSRKIIYRDLKDFLEDVDSISAKKARRDEVMRLFTLSLLSLAYQGMEMMRYL